MRVRVKRATSFHMAASLTSLPTTTGCWKPISIDCVFGLPIDLHGNTSIMVFVDRTVPNSIDGESTVHLFVDRVSRQHELPVIIVSQRNLHSKNKF